MLVTKKNMHGGVEKGKIKEEKGWVVKFKWGRDMEVRGGGRRLTMAEIVFQAFICCDFTQMRFKLGR